MAVVGSHGSIIGKITLVLDEEEAAALEAIAGYGTEAFLKVFYPQLGEHYLRPHEKGLRSLFDAVYGGSAGIGSFLTRFRDANAVMSGQKKAVDQDR